MTYDGDRGGVMSARPAVLTSAGGRPRNPAIDQAVLEAALRILDTAGHADGAYAQNARDSRGDYQIVKRIASLHQAITDASC